MATEADVHQGCGNCCRLMGSPPFMARKVDGRARIVEPFREQIPRELLEQVEEYLSAMIRDPGLDRASQGLPCSWLDTRQNVCLHYQFRPEACREYDCGGKHRRCPGGQ